MSVRITVDVGAVLFGILIGWVTYRALRREGPSGSVSDIASVISAVVGTTITGLFSAKGPDGPLNPPEGLGLYLIGLALGFFAFYGVSILTAKKYGTDRAIAAELLMGVEPSGEEKPPAENKAIGGKLTTSPATTRLVCTSDTATHNVPFPGPTIPSKAGGIYIDPTFNTPVMRLTDENDGYNNRVAYSTWPAFNKDNSRLLFLTDQGTYLSDFNPALFTNFTPTKTPLPQTQQGTKIVGEGAIWSGVDPDLLYGFESLNLWQYDAKANSYNLVKDFSKEPGNPFAQQELWEMSMSLDDDVFSFILCAKGTCSTVGVHGTSTAPSGAQGYFVWRKSTDQLILHQTLPAANEYAPWLADRAMVDKSGKFIVVSYFNPQDLSSPPKKNDIGARVWDLTTTPLTFVDLTAGPTDLAGGHFDNGRGNMANTPSWFNGVLSRMLRSALPTTLQNPTTVLDLGQDISQALHISMHADDESMALISLYYPTDSSVPGWSLAQIADGLYHQEILQASTDGKLTLCRIVHHRSIYDVNNRYQKIYNLDPYEDQPHANISRDGKFVVYTSNWNARLRLDNNEPYQRDVFIAQVLPRT